jgi:hypothetical protein
MKKKYSQLGNEGHALRRFSTIKKRPDGRFFINTNTV